jgi:hypothetical protein
MYYRILVGLYEKEYNQGLQVLLLLSTRSTPAVQENWIPEDDPPPIFYL